MKVNKILISLIMVGLLSCCLTAVFAEDATLSDGTIVTIPEGFTKMDTDSDSTELLLSDENQSNVIMVIVNQNPTEPDQTRMSQTRNGAEFVSENDVIIRDVSVLEQKFTKDGFIIYGYIFAVGDKNYVVSYTTTEESDINDDAHPVKAVINSLMDDKTTE